MRKTPPIPSVERERAISLIQGVYTSWRELWGLCAEDRDWSKQLFPGALFIEDDRRVEKALVDLLECIGESRTKLNG